MLENPLLLKNAVDRWLLRGWDQVIHLVLFTLSFSGQIIPDRGESQTFLTLGENLSSVSFPKGKSGETNTLRVEGLYIVGLFKAWIIFKIFIDVYYIYIISPSLLPPATLPPFLHKFMDFFFIIVTQTYTNEEIFINTTWCIQLVLLLYTCP